MSNSAGGLLDFMRCEKLSRDLYRGESKDLNTGQVYGGQVLGQAINAASDTVADDRILRSAHAYFLRKGDVNEPIIYHVDRALDGGSVSSRVVIASQNGQQILHLSASYQRAEKGLEHSQKIDVPVSALEKAIEQENYSTKHFQSDYFDVVVLGEEDKTEPNSIQYWAKTKEQLSANVREQEPVLAYVSDSGLLFSTLVPHKLDRRKNGKRPKILMASIDHAIWIHRPFRADRWFFYDCQAVSTSGGRGFGQGRLYDQKGSLFASTAQEGLIRLPREE